VIVRQTLVAHKRTRHTGPFKVNGVPLRRVDQAYVIATSTKVDMTGLVLNAKLTDELFTAHKTKKAVKDEATFFNKKQGKLVRLVVCFVLLWSDLLVLFCV
jgi:ribosomal protein L14E/L6E/L27E